MNLMLRLPEELVDLPEPWRITSDLKRNDAVRELQLVPEVFADALKALERTLRALTRLPKPGTLELPEEIGDAYSFVFHKLANLIPVLDNLTEEPFEEYLLMLTDKQPNETTVDNLASAWIYSITAGMSRSVLRWLSENWRKFPQEECARLVDIAEQLLTGLPEDLAITLLTTVASVAGKNSFPLLERVQEQGATPGIREIARRYRAWVPTRDDSGS